MIEIKQLKGQKKYQEVTLLMNKHIQKMSENIKEEEIWFLEHENVFTAGSSTPKEFRIDEINNIPVIKVNRGCLLYTSPSPRDLSTSRMPSSA